MNGSTLYGSRIIISLFHAPRHLWVESASLTKGAAVAKQSVCARRCGGASVPRPTLIVAYVGGIRRLRVRRKNKMSTRKKRSTEAGAETESGWELDPPRTSSRCGRGISRRRTPIR